MITEHVSIKVKQISIFLILLVLFIHSGYKEASQWKFNSCLQYVFSSFLGRLAVPFFFAFSGFFFFLNIDTKVNLIFFNIKKRIYTLFVPYILGCLFFFIFIVVLQVLPFTSQFVTNKILIRDIIGNMGGWIISVFWFNGKYSPMAFHLWYLRDLILLTLISPLMFYFYKYLSFVVLIILFFLKFDSIVVSGFVFSLFWFSLGALIAIKKLKLKIYDNFLLACFLFVFYCVLTFVEIKYENFYLSKLVIVIGLLWVWFSYDLFFKNIAFSLNENRFVSLLISASFFIYVYHEPSINIVRKITLAVFGRNQIGYLISYITTPFIFLLVSGYIFWVLKRCFPRIIKVIVGGRV